MSQLLRSLASDPSPPPFAVLRREGHPGVEVLVGDVVDVPRLADIPVDPDSPGPAGPRVLAAVPYRQVTERGWPCRDDGAPVRCLVVRAAEVLPVKAAVAMLPAAPVQVTGGAFDIDDAAYARVVARVVADEIGRGEGANFVVRRDFCGRVDQPVARVALTALRRLLVDEPAAYWTFALHTDGLSMVGATPERHVNVTEGRVLMNPISGTYRFPADGPSPEGLLRFLADPKEVEELFMVVDEELKMMSRICAGGGRVLGPYLKQMGALAHTEYLLQGHTDLDVRQVLAETMFAPTVTGSPVRNATRVIARHEATPRGYYAGVLALLGYDRAGRQTLDAPILIRTAYLDGAGSVRVPVGATLVRHSQPAAEVAETCAKAAGILRAIGALPPAPAVVPRQRLIDHPGVAQALGRRNDGLAEFWLRPQHDQLHPALAGRSALIVDAEDAWTAMLAHLLRRRGMTVDVRPWADRPDPDGHDLLVAGPGPGDPRDRHDPRLRHLRTAMAARLARRRPLLAVCLSHQLLAHQLGFPVVRLSAPHQGTQRSIDLFGRGVRVGFYNTFVAVHPGAAEAVAAGRRPAPVMCCRLDGADHPVEVAADPATGQVHALRGRAFASVQFHAESVLSPDGLGALTDLVTGLLAPVGPAATPPVTPM